MTAEMKPKVLVIDESRLIREYLGHKLAALGFDVAVAANGFEGGLKLHAGPELVIMEDALSRVSSTQLLERKAEDPNARDAPVIMLSGELTRERILELARFRIRKFLTKPLRIDALIRAISEVLGMELPLDETPCIVDVHYNDGILFVEVAQGLNSETIELLPYRIREVLSVYEVSLPRVLLMITDVRLSETDSPKLRELLLAVRSATGTPWKGMRLLTTSADVRETLERTEECSGLQVAADLVQAMDALLGVKVSDFAEEGIATIRQGLLTAGSTSDGRPVESGLSLRMAGSEATVRKTILLADAKIAVVDDDEVIRSLVRTTLERLGSEVREYANGRLFLQDLGGFLPSLVFLDLMMPEADGFAVMAELAARRIAVPVVVLSALSTKETVVRAAKAGVKSYLIKPIKPEQIVQKALEVVKADF